MPYLRLPHFFFSKATATTAIYTLSLHDALPISVVYTALGRPSGPGDVEGGAMPEKPPGDRKSTRLNSSHLVISYAVFCLKKKMFANQHLVNRKTHAHIFLSVLIFSLISIMQTNH